MNLVVLAHNSHDINRIKSVKVSFDRAHAKVCITEILPCFTIPIKNGSDSKQKMPTLNNFLPKEGQNKKV